MYIVQQYKLCEDLYSWQDKSEQTKQKQKLKMYGKLKKENENIDLSSKWGLQKDELVLDVGWGQNNTLVFVHFFLEIRINQHSNTFTWLFLKRL